MRVHPSAALRDEVLTPARGSGASLGDRHASTLAMNPTPARRLAAAGALAALLAVPAARALEPLQTHMTPPNQPPLGVIEGRDVTPVRELFNRDANVPRLLILLSPT